ncbi:hypothetical protein I317_00802 [Kwoniella heveanensis CBS 569]|nr:hypothetical protein I317_00802 [Kwoniella heveanensis CBS 569]
MRTPGIPWIGYNLLRLTAVIFICWAMAAQFIAIANDISVYSQTSVTRSGAQSNNSDTKDPSSSGVGGQPSTIIGAQAPSASTRDPYAAPTKTAAVVTTGSIATSDLSAPIGAVSPSFEDNALSPSTEEEDEGNVSGRARYSGVSSSSPSASRLSRFRKRDGETEEAGEANWGLSSIPRQMGGMLFTVLSRLVMGLTLALLLLGQIGWPEMFLYRWVPWLGPQSTPIWLGLVQSIIAIENLRLYASPVVLLPAWGLFAIGLVNILLGAILLYLGRNLRKSPPPPLFFNHSTRLLFFTPDPACYNQLLRKISAPQKVLKNGEELELGRTGLPPSSEAKSIGLDDDDEHEHEDGAALDYDNAAAIFDDEEKTVQHEHGQAQRSIDNQPLPLPRAPAHTDVRQGGYPTFSGGGLTDPGRQVPTGYLEKGKDGRLIKFIREDSTETAEPAPPPHAGNGSAGQLNDPCPEVGKSGKSAPPSAWATFKGTSADPTNSTKDKRKHQKERKVQKKDLPPRNQSRGQTLPLPKSPSRSTSAPAPTSTPRRTSHEQSIQDTIARDKSLMERAAAKLRSADSADTIALVSQGKFPATATAAITTATGASPEDLSRGSEPNSSHGSSSSSSRARVPVPHVNGSRSGSLKRKDQDRNRDRELKDVLKANAGKEARRIQHGIDLPSAHHSPSESSYSGTETEPCSTRRTRATPWTNHHQGGQERHSSYSTISATEDLGPRFPLPPDRQGALDDLNEGDEQEQNSLSRNSSRNDKNTKTKSKTDRERSDKSVGMHGKVEEVPGLVSLSRSGSLRGPVPPKRTNSRKEMNTSDQPASDISAGRIEGIQRSTSKSEGPSSSEQLSKEDRILHRKEDTKNRSARPTFKLDRGTAIPSKSKKDSGPDVAHSPISKSKKTPKSPRTHKTAKSPTMVRHRLSLSSIAPTHTPSTAFSRSSSLFSRLSGSGANKSPNVHRKRATTINIHTAIDTAGKLRPSLATGLGRCASTRSMRTARGVRFDLSPSPTATSIQAGDSGSRWSSQAEELTEWEEAEEDEFQPKSNSNLGIRIPGTNIHLPFSLPSTPRSATPTATATGAAASSASRSKKTDSVNTFDSTLSSPEFDLDSDFDPSETEPPSNGPLHRGTAGPTRVAAAVGVGVQQPKVEDRKARSVNVLGGGYLDGGKEHI